jgi:glycosyltransferase involved in cell wall biosynthesis
MSIKISSYIITKNEEIRLEKTLETLSQVADEIIIVDSGSTDKTAQIAKKYQAKFIFNQWQNHSKQKIFAQNKCHHPWLLSIDADEVLSPKLISEIQEFKKKPIANICRLNIKNIYPKQKKPNKFVRKYNLIRLYHKDYATMKDDFVHDRIIPLKNEQEIFQFKNAVHHYCFISFSHYCQKMNFYTDELVNSFKQKGKKYPSWRLITEFPFCFIKYYIIRREFLNGFWGFSMSMLISFYRFLKIVKYFEYKNYEK